MANEFGTNPETHKYRAHLEGQKRGSTKGISDEALTYRLGQLIESKGASFDNYDPRLKEQYYNIKNQPAENMKGILGYPKELYRGARMATLGMAGSALSGMAIPFSGEKTKGIHDWLTTRAQGLQAKASEATPTIVRPTDIRWNNLDEAMRGSLSMFGQALPSLLQSLTAGKIAASGSRALGTALSKKIPEKAMTTRVVKGFPQNISKRDDFINKIESGGMVAGMALNSIGMNAGEIYSSLLPYVNLPESDPEHVDLEDARLASLLGGAMSGSLDSLFPSALLLKFMRGKGKQGAGYWWRFVSTLPKNITIEGATEGMQELINMMSEKYARGHDMTWESLTRDEKKRLMDAGALGAVGGMQGTVIEAFHDPSPENLATDDELEETRAEAQRIIDESQESALAAEEPLQEMTPTFSTGETVTDVETGISGTVKSEEGQDLVVDVEGEEVLIPKTRATQYEEPELEPVEAYTGDRVSYTEGDLRITGIITKRKGSNYLVKDDEDGATYTIPDTDIEIVEKGIQIATSNAYDKHQGLTDNGKIPRMTVDDFKYIARDMMDSATEKAVWDNGPTEEALNVMGGFLNAEIEGYKVTRVWDKEKNTFTQTTRSPKQQEVDARNAEVDSLIETYGDSIKSHIEDLKANDELTRLEIRNRFNEYINSTDGLNDRSDEIKNQFLRKAREIAGVKDLKKTKRDEQISQQKEELFKKKAKFDQFKGKIISYKVGTSREPAVIAGYEKGELIVRRASSTSDIYINPLEADIREIKVTSLSIEDRKKLFNDIVKLKTYDNTVKKSKEYKDWIKKRTKKVPKKLTKKAAKKVTKKATKKAAKKVAKKATKKADPVKEEALKKGFQDAVRTTEASFNQSLQVLGLSENATEAEVNKEWRDRVKKLDSARNSRDREVRNTATLEYERITKARDNAIKYIGRQNIQATDDDNDEPYIVPSAAVGLYSDDIRSKNRQLIYDVAGDVPLGVDLDVADILSNLRDKVDTERGRSAISVMDRIIELKAAEGVKVRFDDFYEMNSSPSRVMVKGKYNHSSRRIHISEQFNTSDVDHSGALAVTLAHEMLHPLFTAARASDDPTISGYMSELDSVFKRLKDSGEDYVHAFTSIDELFVSFLSDSEFADSLRNKSIRDGGILKTVWDWIVSIFQRLLGRNTIYSRLGDSTYGILNQAIKMDLDPLIKEEVSLSLEKVSPRGSNEMIERTVDLIKYLVETKELYTKHQLESEVRKFIGDAFINSDVDWEKSFPSVYLSAKRRLDKEKFDYPLNDISFKQGGISKLNDSPEDIVSMFASQALEDYNSYAELSEQIQSQDDAQAEDTMNEGFRNLRAVDPTSKQLQMGQIDPNVIDESNSWFLTIHVPSLILDSIPSAFGAINMEAAVRDSFINKSPLPKASLDEWDNTRSTTGSTTLDNVLSKSILSISKDMRAFKGARLTGDQLRRFMADIMGQPRMDHSRSLSDYQASRFNYGGDMSYRKRVDMSATSADLKYEDYIVPENASLDSVARFIKTDGTTLSLAEIKELIKTETDKSRKSTAGVNTDSLKLDLEEIEKGLIGQHDRYADLDKERKKTKAIDELASLNQRAIQISDKIVQLEQERDRVEKEIELARPKSAYVDLESVSDTAIIEKGLRLRIPKATGAGVEARKSNLKQQYSRERIKTLEEQLQLEYKHASEADREAVVNAIKTEKLALAEETKAQRPMESSMSTMQALGKGKKFASIEQGAVQLLQGDSDNLIQKYGEERADVELNTPHSELALQKGHDSEAVSRIISGVIYEVTQRTMGTSQGLTERGDGRKNLDNKSAQRTYYQFINKDNGSVVLTGVWGGTKQEIRLSMRTEQVPVFTEEGKASLYGADYLGLHTIDGVIKARYIQQHPIDGYVLLDIDEKSGLIQRTRRGMKMRNHAFMSPSILEGSVYDNTIKKNDLTYSNSTKENAEYIYARPKLKGRSKKYDKLKFIGVGKDGVIFRDDSGKETIAPLSEFKTSDGQLMVSRIPVKLAGRQNLGMEVDVPLMMEPASLTGGRISKQSGKSVGDVIIDLAEQWQFTGESVEFISAPKDGDNPYVFRFASLSDYEKAKENAIASQNIMGMSRATGSSRAMSSIGKIAKARSTIESILVNEIRGDKRTSDAKLGSARDNLSSALNNFSGVITDKEQSVFEGDFQNAKQAKEAKQEAIGRLSSISLPENIRIDGASIPRNEFVKVMSALAKIEVDISLAETDIRRRKIFMEAIKKNALEGHSDTLTARIRTALGKGEAKAAFKFIKKNADYLTPLIERYRAERKEVEKRTKDLKGFIDKWNKSASETKRVKVGGKTRTVRLAKPAVKMVLDGMRNLSSGGFGSRMMSAILDYGRPKPRSSDIPLARYVVEALYGPIRKLYGTAYEPSVQDKYASLIEQKRLNIYSEKKGEVDGELDMSSSFRNDAIWLDTLSIKLLGGGESNSSYKSEMNSESGFVAEAMSVAPDVLSDINREVEFTKGTTLESIASDPNLIEQAAGGIPTLWLIQYNADTLRDRGISAEIESTSKTAINDFISSVEKQMQEKAPLTLLVPSGMKQSMARPGRAKRTISFEEGDKEAISENLRHRNYIEIGEIDASEAITFEEADSARETLAGLHLNRMSRLHDVMSRAWEEFSVRLNEPRFLEDGTPNPSFIDSDDISSTLREAISIDSGLTTSLLADLDMLESTYSDNATKNLQGGYILDEGHQKGNPIYLSVRDTWASGFDGAYAQSPSALEELETNLAIIKEKNVYERTVFNQAYLLQVSALRRQAMQKINFLNAEPISSESLKPESGGDTSLSILSKEDTPQSKLKVLQVKKALNYDEYVRQYRDIEARYQSTLRRHKIAIAMEYLINQFESEISPNGGLTQRLGNWDSLSESWLDKSWAEGHTEIIESYVDGERQDIEVSLVDRPDASLGLSDENGNVIRPGIDNAVGNLQGLMNQGAYYLEHGKLPSRRKYELAYLEDGMSPKKLKELVDTKIAEDKDIVLGEGKEFDYARVGDQSHNMEVGLRRMTEILEDVYTAIRSAPAPIITKGMLADYVYNIAENAGIKVATSENEKGQLVTDTSGIVGRKNPSTGTYVTNPFLILPPSHTQDIMSLYMDYATITIDQSLRDLVPVSFRDKIATEPVPSPADLEPIEELSRVFGGSIYSTEKIQAKPLDRAGTREFKADQEGNLQQSYVPPKKAEGRGLPFQYNPSFGYRISDAMNFFSRFNRQLVNSAIRTFLGDRYSNVREAEFLVYEGTGFTTKIRSELASDAFKDAAIQKLVEKVEPTSLFHHIFQSFFSRLYVDNAQDTGDRQTAMPAFDPGVAQLLSMHPKQMALVMDQFAGSDQTKALEELRAARKVISEIEGLDVITSIAKELSLSNPEMYSEIYSKISSMGGDGMLKYIINKGLWGEVKAEEADRVNKQLQARFKQQDEQAESEERSVGRVKQLSSDLGIPIDQLTEGLSAGGVDILKKIESAEANGSNLASEYGEILAQYEWLMGVKAKVQFANKRSTPYTKQGAVYIKTSDIYRSKIWGDPPRAVRSEAGFTQIIRNHLFLNRKGPAFTEKLKGYFEDEVRIPNPELRVAMRINDLIRNIEQFDARSQAPKRMINRYKEKKKDILSGSYEIDPEREKEFFPEGYSNVKKKVVGNNVSWVRQIRDLVAYRKRVDKSMGTDRSTMLRQINKELDSIKDLSVKIDPLNFKDNIAKLQADEQFYLSKIKESPSSPDTIRALKAKALTARKKFLSTKKSTDERIWEDLERQVGDIETIENYRRKLPVVQDQISRMQKEMRKIDTIATDRLRDVTPMLASALGKTEQEVIELQDKHIKLLDEEIGKIKGKLLQAQMQRNAAIKDSLALERELNEHLREQGKSMQEYLWQNRKKLDPIHPKSDGLVMLEEIRDIISSYHRSIVPQFASESKPTQRSVSVEEWDGDLMDYVPKKKRVKAASRSLVIQSIADLDSEGRPAKSKGEIIGLDKIGKSIRAERDMSDVDMVRKAIVEISEKNPELQQEVMAERLSVAMDNLTTAINKARRMRLLDDSGSEAGYALSEISIPEWSQQDGDVYQTGEAFVSDLISKSEEFIHSMVSEVGGFVDSEKEDSFRRMLRKALAGDLEAGASVIRQYMESNKPDLYTDENAMYMYSSTPAPEYYDGIEKRPWMEDALTLDDASERHNDNVVASQRYNSMAPPMSPEAQAENQQAFEQFLGGLAPQGSAASFINQMRMVGNGRKETERVLELVRALPIMNDVSVVLEPWDSFRIKTRNAPDGHITPAAYNSANKTIYISDAFSAGGNTMQKLLDVMGHELLHPVVRNILALTKDGMKLDRKTLSKHMSPELLAKLDDSVSSISRIYEHVKSKGTGKYPYLHGLSNLDEFIIESLNNEKFREHLKGITLPSSLRSQSNASSWVRNAWDWIVDLISKVISSFNPKGKTAFEQLTQDIDLMFNHYAEATRDLDSILLEETAPDRIYNTAVEEAEAEADSNESFNYDENRVFRAMWELAGVNDVRSELSRAVAAMIKDGYQPPMREGDTPIDGFLREQWAIPFRSALTTSYEKQLQYVPEGTNPESVTSEWASNNSAFKSRATEHSLRLIERLRESMTKASAKLSIGLEQREEAIEEARKGLDPKSLKSAESVALDLQKLFRSRITEAIKKLENQGDNEDAIARLSQVRSLKGSFIVKLISDMHKEELFLSGEVNDMLPQIQEHISKANLPVGSELGVNDKGVAIGLAGAMAQLIALRPVQVKVIELTTDRANQQLIDEISKYSTYSEVRLEAELNRISDDNTTTSQIRKIFLRGWAELLNDEKKLEEQKLSRQNARDGADALRPYSTVLKLRLGALEPFTLSDGAKILRARQVNGEWKIDSEPYEIKIDNSIQPEDREEFNKVIKSNLEFLMDGDMEKAYKGNPLWRAIKQQTHAAQMIPLQKEYANARRASYFTMLMPVNQRFDNMGPLGKSISAKIHQVIVEHKRRDSIHRASALKWVRALKDAAKAFGYDNWSKFIEGPYSDAISWIESRPQYVDDLNTSAQKAFDYLKEWGDVDDRTLLDSRARRAFIKLMKASDDHRKLERNLSILMGQKVRSKFKGKDIMVESDLEPGKFVALHRDPIEIGAITSSRRIHKGVESIVNMMSSRWGDTELEDDEELETPEQVRAYFGKFFENPDVINKFVEPYATMESTADVFFTAGGTPIPQSKVQDAWHSAEGEGVDRFLSWAENIARLTDAKPLDTSVSLLSQLAQHFYKVSNATKEADNLDVIQIAHSVQHKMMDARDLDTIMPREFYLYDSHDEVSANIRLATIIGNSVFGRGGSGLMKDKTSLMTQLRAKRSRLGELVKSAGGSFDTNSWKPNYFYSKGVRKNIEKQLAAEGVKNPAAVFEDLRSGAKQVDQAEEAFKHLENYYGGKDGPYQDVRWLTEMLGLHAFMILSQPKSAMLNFLSIPDIFVFSRGLNKMGLKGTAKALSNVFDQGLGGMMEAFGIQMAKSHRYAQDTGEMFYHFKENELPFRDFSYFAGLRGVGKNNLVERSLTGGLGPLPGMKGLSRMGRYSPASISAPSRQPLTLRTMLPYVGDPFGYVGRMANHSIAFGLASVYHDLVLETAKYLESNKLVDGIEEVTAKDLGYGKGFGELGIGSVTLDKLVLGGETGWENYNIKAVNSGLGSITQMARGYLARKAAGDKRVLTKDQTLSIGVIGLSDIALDGFLARSPWLYTSKAGRVVAPLLGWSLARMNQVNEFMRTPDGRLSMMMFAKYMTLMSASMMPVGLMAAAAMDLWDDEILDKPNSLQKIAPTQMIPVVGMFINKEDPRYNAMAAWERIGRTSSPYGLAYDVVAQVIAHADPTSSARSVSVDSRVLLLSQLQSYISIATTIAQQGGAMDYASVGRPLAYATGLNAAFHYTQALTNAMDIDSEERRIADLTGLKNALRAASKAEDIPLAPVMKFSFGTSKHNMHVRQMVRAAYAGDKVAFFDSYAKAVSALREDYIKKGYVDSPEKAILNRLKGFDPMAMVTRRRMTPDQWARVSRRLSPSQLRMVQQLNQRKEYFTSLITP